MGKKAKIRCFVCQAVFKKKEGELACPGCQSKTVAKLSKKHGRDGGDGGEQEEPKSIGPVDTDGASCGTSPSQKRPKVDHTSAEQSESQNKTSESQNAEPSARPTTSSQDVRQTAAGLLDNLAARVTVVESVGPSFAKAVKDISSSTGCIAVDCEGVKLSRTGPITLVQIATEDSIYLFDVLKMGAITFDGDQSECGKSGLKAVLEDANRSKLMFDCRMDSDALFHQFDVTLRGVLDLQLLAIAAERRKGRTVDLVPGFAKVARQWLGSKTVKFVSFLKAEIKSLYADDDVALEDGESALWGRRPMAIDVIRYAAADVGLQIPLKAILLEQIADCEDLPVGKDDADVMMKRTLEASAKRLEEYRGLDKAQHEKATLKENACAAPVF